MTAGVCEQLFLCNIFAPERRPLLDEAGRELDTLAVIGDDDVNAMLAQEVGLAGKIYGFADNDTG